MSCNALTLFGLADVAALSRGQSVVLELERIVTRPEITGRAQLVDRPLSQRGVWFAWFALAESLVHHTRNC